MKTDDLVTMLASGADRIEPNAIARRYAIALGCGTLAAGLVMAVLLGVRTDLAAALRLPMFWVKLAFAACLAVPGARAAVRVSRPALRLGWTAAALATPVIVMWVLAAVALATAAPAQRAELFFGKTWTSCPFLIAFLSVPLFIAVLWAMKGLAPTRLRLAGATAGLAAGTIAALVYCLHCPELAAPFVGFWYVLGMLTPAAFGALVGPRLLRW